MFMPVVTASLAAVLLGGWTLTETDARRQTPTNRIAGTWRIVEVTRDSAGTRRTAVFPGLYVFTQRHYSITRIDSDKPRKDFPSNLRRTTETYQDIWGPFHAHAGTYEIQGERLRVVPQVAKNPASMKPGSFVMHTWRMVADTLWLLAVADQNGPITSGTQVKLQRVE